MNLHQHLFPIFSRICGENPDHIWSPGGEMLPCCERCTGLYIGALAAVLLQICLKACTSIRWFQIHALFLLQLGLFIFPWIPHSGVLRTISGVMFGFGVVAFLWSTIAVKETDAMSSLRNTYYFLGLLACAVFTIAIAIWGGVAGAAILDILVICGSLTLALTVLRICTHLLAGVVVMFKRNQVKIPLHP